MQFPARRTYRLPKRVPLSLKAESLLARIIRHSAYVHPPEFFMHGVMADLTLGLTDDPSQLYRDVLDIRAADGSTVAAMVDMRNTQFIGADRSIPNFAEGYEPDVGLAIDLLMPDDGVLVDGGANWGYFSLSMILRQGFTGQVFAAEPAARPLADFRALAAAADRRGQITIVPAALSDITAPVLISRPLWSGAASIIGASDGELVMGVRLDDLRLGRIDVFKLDVEGAEGRALTGSLETLGRAKPWIIFESRLDTPSEELGAPFEILARAGYEFFALLYTSHSSSEAELSLDPLTPETRKNFPLHINVLATARPLP